MSLRLADHTPTERDRWLAERLTGIGASDAAAVLGVSPWKAPLALYCEKLGLVDPDAARVEDERLEWGLALEPVIAARFQRETGRELSDPGRYTIQRSATRPYMIATLDRVQHTDRGPGVLEIKNIASYHAEEWAGGEAPLHYQVQVQHQLAVTGYTYASFAVLFGGHEFAWLDIERNDEFIEALSVREWAFWERLERHDPPEPDDSESCRTLLRQLYPREVGGKTIALPPEALAWDRARLEAIEALVAAERAKREAENRLLAALGDAECGILTDGTRYSYKQQLRKGYTVEPATYRVLRRKGGEAR